MGALLNLFRVIVIVWNILFLVTGLILFGVGIFLRFGDSIIDSSVSGVESDLEKALSDAGFGNIDIDVDWSSFFLDTALACIFTGLIIIVITIFGCCGSCCKIRCMLISYVIACVILWLGQTITVGLICGSPNTIQEPLRTKLKERIQSRYAGLDSTNHVSLGWNIVMKQMKCCGVDSYADFTGASNWVIDYTSKIPPITLKTPLACCKTLPSSDDFTCAGAAASSSDNNMNTGCFDEIWDMIFSNKTAVILGALGTTQLLLIFFTIVIICSDKKAKENQVVPDDSIDTSDEKPKIKRPELMFRETGRFKGRTY